MKIIQSRKITCFAFGCAHKNALLGCDLKFIIHENGKCLSYARPVIPRKPHNIGPG